MEIDGNSLVVNEAIKGATIEALFRGGKTRGRPRGKKNQTEVE